MALVIIVNTMPTNDNKINYFCYKGRRRKKMGVGTNLERKSIVGSESCRSVVVGASLPSPRGRGC